MRRKIQWGVVLCLMLAGISGCTLDQIAAQQEKSTDLLDELIAKVSYGQSFVSTHNNLYRIDLGTATYARTNSAAVIFHLRSGPEASEDLFTITIPGPEIQNERPTSVTFPAISDSRGRSFYLYIESPEGTTGDAITVYAHSQDQYPPGTAYQNHQVVSGDLAFTAYSRRTFTFSSVLGDFLLRIAQDLPFFLCYGIMVLVIGAGVFVAFRRNVTNKKRSEPRR